MPRIIDTAYKIDMECAIGRGMHHRFSHAKAIGYVGVDAHIDPAGSRKIVAVEFGWRRFGRGFL